MVLDAKVRKTCTKYGVIDSQPIKCLGRIRKLPLLFLLTVLIQTGCSPPTPHTSTIVVTAIIKLLNQKPTPTKKRLPTRTKTQKPQTSLNACITVNAINVRSGPGTEFSIIGSLISSDCIDIDARNDDGKWLRTTSRDWRMAVHGWVASRYFDIDGNIGILPFSKPDPIPTVTKYRPSPTITRWPTATEGPKPPIQSVPGICDPCYLGVCIPNVDYDLDCGDISVCNFRVTCDPHGFDGDDNGWGCEWCK